MSFGCLLRHVPPVCLALCAALGAAHVAGAEEATPGRVMVGASFALGEGKIPAARGELGTLSKAMPDDPTHPLPRVTVEVLSAKGGIKQAAIQATARREFWGKAVACYRKAAFMDQTLRVKKDFSVEIKNGKAIVGKRKKKNGKSKKAADSASSKADPLAIAEACVLESFNGLEMPNGKRTTATIQVRISAGDEPIAPPDAASERGGGKIDTAELDKSVAAMSGSFTDCYRAGLDYAPKLNGALSVRLKIETTGLVTEAFEAGGPFADERVSRCIVRTFRGAKLPAPTGGYVRVVVPMTLDP